MMMMMQKKNNKKKHCDQKRLISKQTKNMKTESEGDVIETYIDRRRGLRTKKKLKHPTKSLCKCRVKLLFHEDVGFRDLWH